VSESFPTPIRSTYFENRALDVGPEEIVVVSCMRNEGVRLPYFLDYYRRLGVTRFLLVDNDSSDNTREFLIDQPDVEYFWTASSYRGSSAGRLWLHELADRYLTDRWVITVDVDELLVFPGAEEIGLRELCAYMDDNDQRGLFTVLLDMYSDRPLSQTRYEPGSDFLETCNYFETDTYWLSPGSNPPFIGIFGGPRELIFQAEGAGGRRPMMKKIPLVKWSDDFSYIFSTHSHRFIQLSDVTGALLHFKFFDTFEATAAIEAQRGDRRQQNHYRAYRASVAGDICFYGRQSLAYRHPVDLVRLGVMTSSSRYTTYLATHFRSTGVECDVQALLPKPIASEGSMTLRSMAAVWPMVNNRAIGQYFGQVERPPRDRRLAFVEEMSRHIRVLDVRPDHLVIRVEEPALHRWRSGRLGVGVYVGRRLLRNVLLDGVDESLEVDVDSLEPGVCRLWADVAGAAGLDGDASAAKTVAVYLFDAEDSARLRAEPYSIREQARPEDSVLYIRSWHPKGGVAGPEVGFRGAIGRFDNGLLRGWVYDFQKDSFDVPVCVYLNGRLVRYVWPDRRRPDLDELRIDGSTARGRGFLVDLPIGYFAALGDDGLRIDALIAGRNLALRHSPLVLPVGVRQATWDLGTNSWQYGASHSESGNLQHSSVNGSRHAEAAPWWKVWSS